MLGLIGLCLDSPLIVRNAIQDWPALEKWNFDWIHAFNATADVIRD